MVRAKVEVLRNSKEYNLAVNVVYKQNPGSHPSFSGFALWEELDEQGHF